MNRSDLFEASVEVITEGIGHLVFVRTVEADLKARALSSRQRHHADDRLAVDLKSTVIDEKVGLKFARQFDDRCRRPRMQACTVLYGYFSCDHVFKNYVLRLSR